MAIRLEGIARRPSKRAPMEVVPHSTVTRAAGILGDSRGKPSKRQVTVLSADSWRAVERQYGQEIDWRIRRANLFVSGISFSREDIGGTLTIGKTVLEITDECDPCHRMDEQVLGLQALLKPAFTGGVCCKVICDGAITVGDDVILKKPQHQPPLI